LIQTKVSSLLVASKFSFYLLRDNMLPSSVNKKNVEMFSVLTLLPSLTAKLCLWLFSFHNLTVYKLMFCVFLFRICEICSATACNVVVLGDPELSDQWSEANNTTVVQAPQAETRRFWQGHRFLNFLLACMVFAFVISWLFHFNVPG
jgi:hypothetical protein